MCTTIDALCQCKDCSIVNTLVADTPELVTVEEPQCAFEGEFCGDKVWDHHDIWAVNVVGKGVEKAEKLRVKKQEVVDNVSQTYEVERDQADVVATERTNTIREIYKTAPAVPVDCAGSDALRRVLESGVSDANAAASGKPSGPVPDTTKPANGNDRP